MRKLTMADWQEAHDLWDETGSFKYVIRNGQTKEYTKVDGEWTKGIDDGALFKFLIADEEVTLDKYLKHLNTEE